MIRYDDEIVEHTKREFPELFEEPYTKLKKLDEEWMKSKEGKERWRKFMAECVKQSFVHFELRLIAGLKIREEN
jgi:hypothetical protein